MDSSCLFAYYIDFTCSRCCLHIICTFGRYCSTQNNYHVQHRGTSLFIFLCRYIYTWWAWQSRGGGWLRGRTCHVCGWRESHQRVSQIRSCLCCMIDIVQFLVVHAICVRGRSRESSQIRSYLCIARLILLGAILFVSHKTSIQPWIFFLVEGRRRLMLRNVTNQSSFILPSFQEGGF